MDIEFKLGDRVKMAPTCPHYSDEWGQWEGFVTGMGVIARTGAVTLIVSDFWPPRDHGDFVDGFSPDDLAAVTQ